MAKKIPQRKIPVSQQVGKNAPMNKESRPVSALMNTNRLCILLFFISFFLYFNTLKEGYVLDDISVTTGNSIVAKGMSSIPHIFATPYRLGYYITDNDFYRPLSLAMFAVEYQLSDGGPSLSHFINVFFFAALVVLLFLFLIRFFYGRKVAVAFLAALLFAVHPIHTEVVANIKSRDELMCFFFAFLSLLLFTEYVKQSKTGMLIAGIVCFFLSLLSKETSISFLVVIPVLFFFYFPAGRKKAITITVGVVATACLFLVIRFAVLHAYHANASNNVALIDNFLAHAPSATLRLATEFLIMGNYLKLLFVPYPLVCDYSYNSIPFAAFSNISVILSVIAYLLLVIVIIARWLKNKKDPIAFSVFYFLITLLLFTNIPLTIGAPMAERFLFFASAGYCLFIALFIEMVIGKLLKVNITGLQTMQFSKPLVVVAIVLSIGYGSLAYTRNQDWMDNETLFRADVTKAPENSRLNCYLGTELVSNKTQKAASMQEQKQILDEGIKYLQKATEVYPEYDKALGELGTAYFRVGKYDSAQKYLTKTLQLTPNDLTAVNNLAGVYYVTNRFDQAIELCKKVVKVNPEYGGGLCNIGLCYSRMQQYDSAVLYLKKAIVVSPGFNSSYENLALTYKAMGNNDSASKYATIARQNNPGFRM